MIYAHSLGRAARYYSEQNAFSSADNAVATFREIDGRVRQISAALRKHGLQKGDRLAVFLPNGQDYIELVYACARIGLIVVPLNTRLSSTEIDHILSDAGPNGLIRHSTLAAPSQKVPWELVLDQEPPDFHNALETDTDDDPIYDPEAVFALIYTSGTTGKPKGVALTHANILADVDHVNYWIPYVEGGAYLHSAPIFHIADFPFIFGAPAFGVRQVTIPKFSPQTFCETVQREKITHTVLVPTMINLLVQFPDLRKYDLSSLRALGYGGSPIAPELIQQTRKIFPNTKLLQIYGLTESGFLTGLRDQDHTEDRLMSCGRACPGVDLRVVDQAGKEVPVGQPGELVARGANIMQGYWNNAEETAQAFRNGFFRTGDVGYQDSRGFVYILDRIKDMIVTGGENVHSGEVEAVIYEHPAIREAAVFGIPDPQWGELVMAVVALKPGLALSAEELVAHCRKSLASYKIPRRVEFSETDLPKGGSGKILKRSLRERFWLHRERDVG
jgi:long-chain acyl-CoA synthetase